MSAKILALCMCFAILLCFRIQGPPQTHPPATVKNLQAGVTGVLEQQEAAWNQGDVDRFMDGYWKSPEVTFAGKGGISRGWEQVRARYHREYPDKAAMGELDFSRLEIRALGADSALVLGRWHLHRESGDLGGVFTLVFQRFGDGWRIVHDHTSLNAPIQP